jgi:hypothetical protein
MFRNNTTNSLVQYGIDKKFYEVVHVIQAIFQKTVEAEMKYSLAKKKTQTDLFLLVVKQTIFYALSALNRCWA